MSFEILPTANACLNATAALLLSLGFVMIRQGRVRAHKVCMISAFCVSAVFLVSYVVHHVHHGFTAFPGTGWVRPLYFSILISHTILAIATVPMAITTLIFALRGRLRSHRRVARWTLPVWLYISVTGVIIYFMVYHLPGGI